jgi:hypothetical protein
MFRINPVQVDSIVEELKVFEDTIFFLLGIKNDDQVLVLSKVKCLDKGDWRKDSNNFRSLLPR